MAVVVADKAAVAPADVTVPRIVAVWVDAEAAAAAVVV